MSSTAFRKFKKETGQANHFLITLLVGLDAVEDGATKRDSFDTVWNPENITHSARRSRQYAIKSALSWTVDMLDMYLRLCNRSPKLYNDKESAEIASTKHSVYKKFNCVISNHAEISVDTYAYVDLIICWRNNTTHFDADNQLLPATNEYFANISPEDPIVSIYHLEVDQMMEKFKNGETPTFKEITTLISKVIHFVEELDVVLLNEVNQSTFLQEQLANILNQNGLVQNVFSSRNATQLQKAKKIKQLFITHGICKDFYNKEGNDYIQSISQMTEKEFKQEMIGK